MTKSINLSIVSVVLGIAMVFAFALPLTADAITQAEADAIISALGLSGSQADVINALVDGGHSMGSGDCNFTRSLMDGASGADVTCLQDYLTGTGHFNFAGGSTGYYGPVTTSAVAAWQAAHGVSPAVGYFGPISQAKYNMLMGGSGSGDDNNDDNSGPLSGGAGSLDDVDFVSNLSNEEVGEDEDDVEVAGIDIEADGSDLEITAVELNFSKASANSGDDLDDYARDVSIWLDGEMFAQVDADEFEDDDNYDDTVSLDRGAIIREGDEGRLVVAVSGASSLDSDQTGDTWTVEFETVRYRDGQGSVISDSSTGDINDGTGKTFSFESFASAADANLVFTLGDDSPDSTVINVDDSDDTDNVELLRFEIEAEGDSDLRLRDLPITLTVTGATDIDALANTVRITIDGEEFSETLSTSSAAGSTTFDDFDYTIDAGDTVEAVVEVDLNDTSTSGFDEGDTIKAEFTASNRNMLDVDDESGETLVSGDRTGTALGEAMALYDVAPVISLVSVDEEVSVDDGNDDDTGTFTIKYDVTAVDGDIYVSDTAAASTVSGTPTGVGSNQVVYVVDKSGTATTADLNAVVSFTEDGNRVTDSGVTNGVKVTEGSTGNFTIVITRTNSGDSSDNGLYRAAIKAISWAASDSSTQNVYTFDLEEYETDYVSLD